jgi:hypothetical protein
VGGVDTGDIVVVNGPAAIDTATPLSAISTMPLVR